MDGFEKKLNFTDDDTFDQVKSDMTFVIQRLFDTMVEKGAREGSMTVKIDVKLISEFIPNYNPEIEGESRKCLKPQFEHKVTSQVKISDEKKGNMDPEMELVQDEETGLYAMRPVADTTQKSIFDTDYRCANNPEETETEESSEDIIEGEEIPALPFKEDEDVEDISDEIFGEGMDYENPEE